MMDQEEIVMTPTKKGKMTCIFIEKVKRTQLDSSKVAHQGGGANSGLVINKKLEGGIPDTEPYSLQLEFKCFLVDKKTGRHVPESRVLKFWFSSTTDYLDKVTSAYEFFKELVKPDQFPRDYVGFIKRVMTQCRQTRYINIKKVEVDMEQLEEQPVPLTPGGSYQPRNPWGAPKEDTRPREVIVQEQILLTLESAYPNILPVEELAKIVGADAETVRLAMEMLQGKDLIRQIEPGRFVRKVLDDKTEVKVMKNFVVSAMAKPTIAIVTSKYNEKLAVDAMMTNKTTYVRFKTEGESNVYTIGEIGSHKVVTTKIPQLGRQMAAQISSGNTMTRLLGTFSDVEHVLLVGVAGGVPHYTDYYKHVRLGDIVMATPNQKGFMYIFCDKIETDRDSGQMQYALKSWSPHDMTIQRIFENIQEDFINNPSACPWEGYIKDGQLLLQGQEVGFLRPSSETDKLYMNIGGNDVIEVGHPAPPPNQPHRDGQPVLRAGSIGSGKPIISDDALRLDFSTRHNCVSFDTEFDQVLESIVGNRKDSFAFIRGISDYLDGTKNVEWQPYAALAAAAFTKTLIERLPAPS